MLGAYLVKPLAHDQVLQAFPLVSLLDVELSPEQWTGYAGALTEPGRGAGSHQILTVQSGQGHIYGLSAYGLKPDLRRNRVLEIENFAVVDLTGTRRVAGVLIAGLEKLAREQDCSCMVVSLLNPFMRRWLRDPHHPAVEFFRSSGFQGEHLRLRKCFDPALKLAGAGAC